MRHPMFFFYLFIFIGTYVLLNAYIFLHGYRMIGDFGMRPAVYTSIFLVLSSSYIIWELIQRNHSSIFSDILITFWSLWFVGIVHFFFASLGFDILKFLHSVFGIFSPNLIKNIAYHLTWFTIVSTVSLIFIGYINARTPVIREHTITINKKNPVTDTLRLAIASDIHLGPINGGYHAERVVAKINALNPDIILLPGDILDGEVDPVIRRDLWDRLKQLSAKYGVYGVLGNHEYIWGVNRAADYLTEHGVTLLRDQTLVTAGVTLIGRDDLSSQRFGTIRKSLAELIEWWVDTQMALILMDHQPKNLFEAEQNGIDVQFSWHTHNGQLFPLNYIVKQIFELARGYKQKGNTHIFVSSGVGTWWPPVRTNARPEILLVTLKFQPND